ncbi:MAG: serine/threonine-protein kinase [Planctomycetota bacterium]|nr:serine/threonine-protein kinase [Planctomycetota bacterium]
MTSLQCPTRDELESFLAGDLPGGALTSFSAHIASCKRCESAVSNIQKEHDRVAQLLAASSRNDEANPGYRASLRRLQAIVSGEHASKTFLQEETNGREPASWAIGKYRILEELGRGGMGIVYKAKQEDMGQPCAVKVLPHIRSKEQVERFRREMQAVGVLNHPNIVTPRYADIEGDPPYLVLEFIDGFNLSQLLKQIRGTLLVPDACEIVYQVALGLQHAHDQGFIHRDLKPSNIMLSADGSVKILDFGIARNDRDEEITATGQRIGTLGYMSPEQINSAHRVDQRADIYSLGVTLYKLLAGSDPFEDDQSRTKTTTTIATQSAPSLRRLRPDVPRALAKVVRKMLSKNVSRRHRDATTVASLLRPYTSGADLQALAAEATVNNPLNSSRSYRHVPIHRRALLRIWRGSMATLKFLGSAFVILVLGVLMNSDTKRPDRSETDDSRVEVGGAQMVFTHYFEDRFDDVAIDRERWKTHLPHKPWSFVGIIDSVLVLRNRGYLVTREDFPDGVAVSLQWVWNDGDGNYSDTLAVVLRTSGIPSEKWSHEPTDGVRVEFQSYGGTISIRDLNTGEQKDEWIAIGLALPRYTAQSIRITDDGRTINVYVADHPAPVVTAEVEKSAEKHHVAFYNREYGADIGKESVFPYIRIDVPVK